MVLWSPPQRAVVFRAFQRIAAATDLLRPQTFFRTLARVDELADRTRELRTQMAVLERRTAQLLAIEHLDGSADLEQLSALDPERIKNHIRCAVASSVLEHDPFPYTIVQDWLPPDVYQLVLRGIPPAVFFTSDDGAREQLAVPLGFGPRPCLLIWRYVTEQIVAGAVHSALSEKFRDVISEYVGRFCPTADVSGLTLHASNGRLMLRRPGYVITPHRDPKWGFLTGLAYLARPGDDDTHGTQLYRVRDDEEAPSDKPYYVEPGRCELVRRVPFAPNTLLVFLNSAGAHGASIPADAQPPTLERYAYQFRLGPSNEAIAALLAGMAPAVRASWKGAKSSRATGPPMA